MSQNSKNSVTFIVNVSFFFMGKTGTLLNSITDNALMQRVKAGDVNKLGLLYERYNEMLFGFFFRNTGSAETSEDLVQTVFFRILKYKKQFRNEGKFTTWMYRIAHNVVYDHYRKNKHKSYSIDDIQDTLKTEEYADDDLLNNENSKIIRDALNKLTEEQREVLILSKYHDIKYKEIGEICNISETAVKARIFRAIQELRKILKKTDR